MHIKPSMPFAFVLVFFVCLFWVCETRAKAGGKKKKSKKEKKIEE
jgi:hypothetical protein